MHQYLLFDIDLFLIAPAETKKERNLTWAKDALKRNTAELHKDIQELKDLQGDLGGN